MSTYIGHKVIVAIGGTPPVDVPGEIIGHSTKVHVPNSMLHQFDTIIGASVDLIVCDKTDETVKTLVEKAKALSLPEGESIRKQGNLVLQEVNLELKRERFIEFLKICANLVQFASVVKDIIKSRWG